MHDLLATTAVHLRPLGLLANACVRMGTVLGWRFISHACLDAVDGLLSSIRLCDPETRHTYHG